MAAKDGLGRYGEALAVRHLQHQGMSILERNWRCRAGEIDIIALDGSCLVFCEVKTRSSTLFGEPVEAVGPVKAGRLRRLAAQWLAEHTQPRDSVRFDVVGIVRPRTGAAVIDHRRAVL